MNNPRAETRTIPLCARIAARCGAILFLALLAGCHAGRPGGGQPAHPIPSAAPAPFANGINFRDVAAAAGVSYRWTPHHHPLTIGDSMGCGCAFFDFDNDGWQDILLVASPTVRLYHNLHNGHFEDVTHRAGLESVRGEWRGVAVGDFNGDGRLDLLLTGYHRLALLKNMGGERFVDVTTAAGLDPSNRGHWASSAGFMDLDGDGWLDLVLLNYVDFGPRDRQYCTPRPGIRIGCPPKTYRAELPELWKNLGDGRFKNVTAGSGLESAHGNGLTLAFCGLEGGGRGRVDFYIGNDTLPADLMINDGHGHFKNIGAESGVSRGMMSQPVAAMGADWGDYDRDGRFDLIVPDFSDELYELFHNLGSHVFEDTGPAMGLVKATYGRLGFGAKWIDMDNDGWPDVVIANGHVYDNPSPVTASATFRESLSILRNSAGKQLIDIVPRLDPSMQRTLVGRGLASGDFDNDGRVDFLVVDAEGPA
ncbi:MAG: VCBS repeat-containing protein, partial [Chloroflexi bacterium]|nr:VCBS repeat-containing protein [Chloroflexota bacterium]